VRSLLGGSNLTGFCFCAVRANGQFVKTDSNPSYHQMKILKRDRFERCPYFTVFSVPANSLALIFASTSSTSFLKSSRCRSESSAGSVRKA
jgi:hypothetical protein